MGTGSWLKPELSHLCAFVRNGKGMHCSLYLHGTLDGGTMWTDKSRIADHYKQFETILYRWCRFMDLFLGRDILHSNFKIDIHTIGVTVFLFTNPFLFL